MHVRNLLLLAVCVAAPSTLPAQQFAYVTNRGNVGEPNALEVVIVNIAANDVIARIELEPNAPDRLAVRPDGKEIYVTFGNFAQVLDARQRRVIATIPLDGNSEGVAFSADGTRAFFAARDGRVFVVDTASRTVVETLSAAPALATPEGKTVARARGAALSPDGTRAYVPSFDEATLAAVDTATGDTISTLQLPVREPSWVARSPGAETLYIAHDRGYVVVVDIPTLSVVATVMLDRLGDGEPDSGVTGIAVTPDGERLYVPSGGGTCSSPPPPCGYIAVIDTSTLAVVATFAEGTLDDPFHIEMSPPAGRRSTGIPPGRQ